MEVVPHVELAAYAVEVEVGGAVSVDVTLKGDPVGGITAEIRV